MHRRSPSWRCARRAARVGQEPGRRRTRRPRPSRALDDLLWVARPLVVFADTPRRPALPPADATGSRPTRSRSTTATSSCSTDTDPAANGPLRQRLRPRGFGAGADRHRRRGRPAPPAPDHRARTDQPHRPHALAPPGDRLAAPVTKTSPQVAPAHSLAPCFAKPARGCPCCPNLAVAACLAAAPALAQNLPPANALPLSQIVATVETQPVRVFTEVEWDNDGYWDVEFINTDNRRTSLRIDPFSGEPLSRRRR